MTTTNETILEKSYRNLILQISLTELSYCVKDSLKNKIERVGNYFFKSGFDAIPVEDSLKNAFAIIPELNAKYDKIIILHANNLFALIPNVLFDENNLNSYLQYNAKIFETDSFNHDSIANYDIMMAYVPYVNINNLLIDYLGDFTYKHAYSILIQKALDKSKNIDKTQLFVHIQKNNFQITAVQNQKLILFNTFEYKTEIDFIYYLLFTIEQLGLNPEIVPLQLLGDIKKEYVLYKIAYTYIRNIVFLNESNNLIHALSPSDYLQHYINIHTCE